MTKEVSKMKKHLFYLFLVIYGTTALIALLGVIKVLHIDDFYLNGLFANFLIQSVAAVTALFRKTDFFGDSESEADELSEKSKPMASVGSNSASQNSKDLEKKSLRAAPVDLTQGPTNPSKSTLTVVPGISVREIVDTVNAAPPLQQEELSAKYAGLNVEWIGYLKTAQVDWRDKSLIRVNIHTEQDNPIGPSIWFTTKMDEIPGIQVLKAGSKILVRGLVISVSGPGLGVTIQPTEIRVIEMGSGRP